MRQPSAHRVLAGAKPSAIGIFFEGSVLSSVGRSPRMLSRLFAIWFANIGDLATPGSAMGGVTPRVAHPGSE